MIARRHLTAVVVIFLVSGVVWGQTPERTPHIGYLYPAGGQKGATIQIRCGGQFLRGASAVYVSGEGVHASVAGFVEGYRPLNNKDQFTELRRRLVELRAKQPGASAGPLASAAPVPRPASATKTPAPNEPAKPGEPKKDVVADHPLLKILDKLNPKELEYVTKEFLAPFQSKAKKQPNAQIAETVLIEIKIDANAAPGDRDMRIATAGGLTNPMCFQVGQLPEVCEPEQLSPMAADVLGVDPRTGKPRNGGGAVKMVSGVKVPTAADVPLVDLPATFNGQVLPGEVDRFRFQARQGQKLVIQAQARGLIPYLADAVPGWFQATLTLFDARGKEVAFADDYHFDPDPVLFFEIPKDGEYRLEICDALYRGREDFVYRISVGELPFITGMYPLGGMAGAATTAWVAGWNLPVNQVSLDMRPGAAVRQSVVRSKSLISNPITYAVGSLPEIYENEPNDANKNAQTVSMPQLINGYIAQPGDEDIFKIHGRAGEKVVAEVYARRLNSPLDSLLRLTNAAGKTLVMNDDFADKGTGLITHHADSFLSATLPQDGDYYLHLSDAQRHGGAIYGYRLRITAPAPDFALRVTPSSLNVAAGRPTPITVFALRSDGFNGDVDVSLKNAPAGFTLSGGRIPAGRDHVRMTLSAPPKAASGQPVSLRFEGRAKIGGQMVARQAVPAEDMMQAFLYRHLTPEQDLLVSVRSKFAAAPIELASAAPVRIPEGGGAQVRVRTPKLMNAQNVRMSLSDAPKGIALQDIASGPEGIKFTLKADASAPKAGYADNLIVEVFTETGGAQPAGAPPKQKQRVSLGVLPAIPFEIVQR